MNIKELADEFLAKKSELEETESEILKLIQPLAVYVTSYPQIYKRVVDIEHMGIRVNSWRGSNDGSILIPWLLIELGPKIYLELMEQREQYNKIKKLEDEKQRRYADWQRLNKEFGDNNAI